MVADGVELLQGKLRIECLLVKVENLHLAAFFGKRPFHLPLDLCIQAFRVWMGIDDEEFHDYSSMSALFKLSDEAEYRGRIS